MKDKVIIMLIPHSNLIYCKVLMIVKMYDLLVCVSGSNQISFWQQSVLLFLVSSLYELSHRVVSCGCILV